MKLTDLPRETIIRLIIQDILDELINSPTLPIRIHRSVMNVMKEDWNEYLLDPTPIDELVAQVKVALITRIQYRS